MYYKDLGLKENNPKIIFKVELWLAYLASYITDGTYGSVSLFEIKDGWIKVKMNPLITVNTDKLYKKGFIFHNGNWIRKIFKTAKNSKKTA